MGAIWLQAGKAMDEIVGHVTKVTELMDQIASACAEQSAGIDEINRAVTQIEGITQQNAVLVQEVTRTAAGLQDEAEQLTEALGHFHLGEREFGNAQEAGAMVSAAVAFVRKSGAEALINDVNKLGKGQFIDRDLYLSIYALDGHVAAHGMNRRFWNIDWSSFKDTDGRLFIVEMVNAAKAKGHGWIDYKWVNPVSKKQALKTAYFQRCGDLVIACGFLSVAATGSVNARTMTRPAKQLLSAR